MPTWAQLLAAAFGLVGAGTPGVLAYRAASRANRQAAEESRRNTLLEDRKVDAAAFRAAQDIYERGLKEANKQLGQCRAELESVRAELDAERKMVGRLHRRIAALERAMTAAGVPVPSINGLDE